MFREYLKMPLIVIVMSAKAGIHPFMDSRFRWNDKPK